MTDSIPNRPLRRFCRVYEAVMSRKGWADNVNALRYCAAALTTAPGAPTTVAERLYRAAADLKGQARWFGPLNSALRFLVAAVLLRSRGSVDGFRRRLEDAEQGFKRQQLGARGTAQTVAFLILEQYHAGRVPAEAFAAVRAHYDVMKSHHGWLTDKSDLPACALLTRRDEGPGATGRRCERIYDGLRREGLPMGNPLQLTSHVMCMADGRPDPLVKRFIGLHRGFRKAGVSMWQTDFDELAVLTFLDLPAREVVRTVVEHRAKIAELTPKPDAVMSFSLAAGTAFLEFGGRAREVGLVSDAQTMIGLQSALAAQQAAMVACMAATTAACAASS